MIGVCLIASLSPNCRQLFSKAWRFCGGGRAAIQARMNAVGPLDCFISSETRSPCDWSGFAEHNRSINAEAASISLLSTGTSSAGLTAGNRFASMLQVERSICRLAAPSTSRRSWRYASLFGLLRSTRCMVSCSTTVSVIARSAWTPGKPSYTQTCVAETKALAQKSRHRTRIGRLLGMIEHV